MLNGRHGDKIMYYSEFVSKKQYAPIKHDLIDMIIEVQNLLQNEFTLRFDFNVYK